MTAATSALRAAIHQALNADGALIAALGGARVYDEPPRRATFPYVTLGEARVNDISADGGNAPTSIGSFDELKDVLRAAGVPPFHKVSTYRVLRRLEDAGRIDAAEAALNANRVLWRRFYTVGAINADDADSRAFLATIGADADAILAPE